MIEPVLRVTLSGKNGESSLAIEWEHGHWNVGGPGLRLGLAILSSNGHSWKIVNRGSSMNIRRKAVGFHRNPK